MPARFNHQWYLEVVAGEGDEALPVGEYRYELCLGMRDMFKSHYGKDSTTITVRPTPILYGKAIVRFLRDGTGAADKLRLLAFGGEEANPEPIDSTPVCQQNALESVYVFDDIVAQLPAKKRVWLSWAR